MPKAKEVVIAYQQAVGNGELAAARALLHNNLEFRGPLETFHDADGYLRAIQKLSSIVERVAVLKVFEDGDDVGLFCELVIRQVGTLFVAEWYHVKQDKIASIRVAFDARPFAAMFAKPPA